MLKSKTFLGIDFGAGTLKIAEFDQADGGGLRLIRFGTKPLGLAGSQDAAREKTLQKALGELLAEGGFTTRTANISAPGYQVFSKFVKLPPVDTSKVTQIIQYEAQQNVPFPLAETSWDYQILGTSASGELEVLLVAIKSDVVEKLFGTAEGSGFRMDIVDASVAALANSFRYNYGDQEGCSLLIDIGAKTSNVLLFEKNKFYARSINAGANAITQEFDAEVKLPFAEAEKFKIAEGFVSLGGAYEEPDNPKQAAISKIARKVLTGLHLQVNQTIQFYRTQQGGSAPTQVFLCGGGAGMAYATEFFREKLNLPVEFFNPFRNVEIGQGVDVTTLEKIAQCFGEVVGLGLRNIAQCPVELNLMPKTSKARQEFASKKPYLLASAFALVVGAFAYGLFYSEVQKVKNEALEKINQELTPLQGQETRLQSEEASLKKATNELVVLQDWMSSKATWADILTEVRQVLLKTEANSQAKLGREVGVWVHTLLSTEPSKSPDEAGGAEEENKPRAVFMDPLLAKRYGLWRPGYPGYTGPGTVADPNATPAADGAAAATTTDDATAGGDGAAKKATTASTNEIATINVKIRATNMRQVSPQANNEIAYDLEKELRASKLFDEKETALSGESKVPEDSSPYFEFDVKLKLKHPIKL